MEFAQALGPLRAGAWAWTESGGRSGGRTLRRLRRRSLESGGISPQAAAAGEAGWQHGGTPADADGQTGCWDFGCMPVFCHRQQRSFSACMCGRLTLLPLPPQPPAMPPVVVGG